MIVAFRSAKVRRVKALLQSKRRQSFAPLSLSSLRSGVGILPAIESTLENRNLEADATLLPENLIWTKHLAAHPTKVSRVNFQADWAAATRSFHHRCIWFDHGCVLRRR